MFWENLCALCATKNTSPTSVVTELELSRGSVTSWKNGKVPHHSTLLKIADYFGVSVDYLLTGEACTQPSAAPGRGPISDAELKFALWGDSETMDDQDLADVRRYAAFVRERKKDLK